MAASEVAEARIKARIYQEQSVRTVKLGLGAGRRVQARTNGLPRANLPPSQPPPRGKCRIINTR